VHTLIEDVGSEIVVSQYISVRVLAISGTPNAKWWLW